MPIFEEEPNLFLKAIHEGRDPFAVLRQHRDADSPFWRKWFDILGYDPLPPSKPRLRLVVDNGARADADPPAGQPRSTCRNVVQIELANWQERRHSSV